MEVIMLVAVYGTLKSTGSARAVLLNFESTHVSDVHSHQITMYKTPYGFPGAVKKTPVSPAGTFIELWEITYDCLKFLDSVEGVVRDNPRKGLFRRETIETEYGVAYVYLYNGTDMATDKEIVNW
jgi:gamma-glutamylcyclotransferase (GGCT)/AIG2-like uncharacterized protein YtfP